MGRILGVPAVKLPMACQTHQSWSRKRRVVGKAEVTEQGRNPRFVVTNLATGDFAPAKLYKEIYCARAEMENQFKVQQLVLFAGRTSNQHADHRRQSTPAVVQRSRTC